MFNELLESTIVQRHTSKRWTVALSTLLQTVILGVLVLTPLMRTDALRGAIFSTPLVAPPPPPPPPSRQTVGTTVRPGLRLIHDGVLWEPPRIPAHVAIIIEPVLPPDVSNDGPVSGPFANILGRDVLATRGPAIPAPPKQTAPARIKQGGMVTAAALVSQTRPIYPVLARQVHEQGDVLLHAIIDKDGRVAQLEVVSGHPLLVQAALDAVKQWLYRPTLLNGEPVEVDTTITVTFTLSN